MTSRDCNEQVGREWFNIGTSYVCAIARHGVPPHNHPFTANSRIVVLTCTSLHVTFLITKCLVRRVMTRRTSCSGYGGFKYSNLFFPEPPTNSANFCKVWKLRHPQSIIGLSMPTQNHPQWAQVTHQMARMDRPTAHDDVAKHMCNNSAVIKQLFQRHGIYPVDLQRLQKYRHKTLQRRFLWAYRSCRVRLQTASTLLGVTLGTQFPQTLWMLHTIVHSIIFKPYITVCRVTIINIVASKKDLTIATMNRRKKNDNN